MTKRAGELIKEELEALDHPERGTDPSAATPGDTTNHGTIGSGIQINGLTKTYERVTRKEIVRTHALSGVDLQVRSKEFVSLIGPSGCGKTTVLKIIAGLLRPTKGDVLIEGRRVTGPGTDRATVFQSPGLMPWKSVIDNVILALEFADVSKAQRRGRAIKYVDRVGLREFHDHYPGELSGGMQQRVGIARALATDIRCGRDELGAALGHARADADCAVVEELRDDQDRERRERRRERRQEERRKRRCREEDGDPGRRRHLALLPGDGHAAERV